MSRGPLFDPIASPYLVPFAQPFDAARAPTKPPEDAPSKKDNQAALVELVERLAARQALMYADNRYSVLVVFQAMDAAGKDGTLRAVLSGVNPAGVEVASFKAPTPLELDHDFLWRCNAVAPPRGKLGIWNRSHYEEVLAVRVNPQFLGGQRLPSGTDDLPALWAERYESIRAYEQHLARNGTVILKFWFNVSKDEQRDRLLERIDQPESNWKFNADDLAARSRWSDYMSAYSEAITATSRPWAPWYAVPADSKSFMRRTVADILVSTLEQLPVHWPEVSEKTRAEMQAMRAQLAAE